MKSSSGGASSSNILPMRSRFEVAIYLALLELERGLVTRVALGRSRGLDNVGPSGCDCVEGEGVLRPAVLLGDREKQERELFDELDIDRAVRALVCTGEEGASGRQAVPLKPSD